MGAESFAKAPEAVDGRLEVAAPVATPAQCRAGRALLRWTQHRLASEAGVARKTIADFEADKRLPRRRTRSDITAALRLAGLEFLGGAGEDGVHFRLPSGTLRKPPIIPSSA